MSSVTGNFQTQRADPGSPRFPLPFYWGSVEQNGIDRPDENRTGQEGQHRRVRIGTLSRKTESPFQEGKKGEGQSAIGQPVEEGQCRTDQNRDEGHHYFPEVGGAVVDHGDHPT